MLGVHQGMREALIAEERTKNMDYLVAGLCALFLFFYLIYALLKPERF